MTGSSSAQQIEAHDLYARCLIEVARPLAESLKGTEPLQKEYVRSLATKAFGGSDSEGSWGWKDVYEAQEIALIMLLHAANRSLQSRTPEEVLAWLKQKESLILTNTFRSEDQQRLQQFSTPIPLGYLVALAAQIQDTDFVLEPSAGTGMLATFARIARARLVLNELDKKRSAILSRIFSDSIRFSVNAESLNDLLPKGIDPTVVLMNPPFSHSPDIRSKRPVAIFKHLRSALLRLVPGGRLVLVSGNGFSPLSRQWLALFGQLQTIGTIVGSWGVVGSVYRKAGTTIDTRITVIDKVPSPSPALIEHCIPECLNSAQLLERILALPKRKHLAPVLQLVPSPPQPSATDSPVAVKAPKLVAAAQNEAKPPAQPEPEIVYEPIQVSYRIIEVPVEGGASEEALYEEYSPKRIAIDGAHKHPTTLVESVAMASVSPPIPTYRPILPQHLITQGILSSAQLESIVYAGAAHEQFLQGFYRVDDTYDEVSLTSSEDEDAVRFRRGWFLGDGTGCGKGRQVAGVILDGWLRGRTRAVWISKSDKLIEDAKRDWVAVGGNPDEVVSLAKRWNLGEAVDLPKGILFVTYSTLASERQGKSRFQQIVQWLGRDFDGVIVFDEAHAMAHAIAEAVESGHGALREPSQQGVKGLRLQNAVPSARILYVSATGATEVSNLAYASRLGLWQTGEFPFPTRNEFIEAIESGGIAAMEVICRDLKALGLYLARNLSFEGVVYEPLEVELTEAQIALYDQYAEAFMYIHQQINDALQAANVVGITGKTQNGRAKMVAYSIFEGTKQRFFNHVLTSMKAQALMRSIEADIAAERSPVIQIVSTNESLIKRKLDQVPVEQWDDLDIDITPREAVIEYLLQSFPIHLYVERQDEEGRIYSELAKDSEGNPIISQEAVAIRDGVIERISLLPPLPGLLEQLLHHFGHDAIAEVTGRSERILKDRETGRLKVVKRPTTANSTETAAFMDGEKRILIFSEAGGTGRSYHADRNCGNQWQRVHYLVEAGFKAASAIQGLGRSHRTNQVCPPIFRPVVTNVQGELRFKSTIAKRIAQLGALTKGERRTGGSGLYSDKDNLESRYAIKALHIFYQRLYSRTSQACTMVEFEHRTGLRLIDSEGNLKLELPGINTFLNRILAIPIRLQNAVFAEFEDLLEGIIDAAVSAGTYETGLEVLTADGFRLISRSVVHTHQATGATVLCNEIEEKHRLSPRSAENALLQGENLLINTQSGRAAVAVPTNSAVSDDGTSLPQMRLIRPLTSATKLLVSDLIKSNWKQATREAWEAAWNQEIAEAPEFSYSRFYLISGLLLPVWAALEKISPRVYRLTLEDGERLLGRKVDPKDMPMVAKAIGIASEVTLTPQEMHEAVIDFHQTIPLKGGLSLRRSFVQLEWRIEVTGTLSPDLIERLKLAGCFTEMIQWKTRVFITTRPSEGASVIGRVLNLL